MGEIATGSLAALAMTVWALSHCEKRAWTKRRSNLKLLPAKKCTI